MTLTDQHIHYIIQDLTHRGILLDGLRDELIDHICSAVENEMLQGKRFMEAYQLVVMQFGDGQGLLKTQQQVLRNEHPNSRIMLQNYFKIALRNLHKHRFYTLINITGLAFGIATCLLIGLYIVYELSFDQDLPNLENLYRVDCDLRFNGNDFKLAVAPAPAAQALQTDFPEVVASTRLRQVGAFLVRHPSQENIREPRIVYADSNFFRVFQLRLVAGRVEGALAQPNTMVMTQRMAEKYFPGENALGKTLLLNNTEEYMIKGIMEERPENAHFHFDFLLSMEGLSEGQNNTWISNNFNTYISVRPQSDIKLLESKFPAMVDKYVGPQLREVFGGDYTMDKFREAGNRLSYSLMPVGDIHLYAARDGEIENNGSMTYVYLLLSIGLFILAIACINFMNLSTARSANRAKEVGIRKALGSMRGHLVRQFLMESILISMVSFLLAVAIAYTMMPLFNNLASRNLTVPIGNPLFLLILFGGAVFVGCLAGLYPSFFLSAFKPANVLKGRVALGMKSGALRSGLVVFQFMISIFLIIGTLAVQQQLQYIQQKKLGFSKDQVLIVNDAQVLKHDIDAYKVAAEKMAGVQHVSLTNHLPVAGWGRNSSTLWPYGADPTQHNMVTMQIWTVDKQYVKTLGMEVLQGRDFSTDFLSDSTAIILNETAVKMLSLKEPIGQRLTTFATNPDNSIDQTKTEHLTVVGIVRDFHFESLKEHIGPLCLRMGKAYSNCAVRFQGADAKQVIAQLEKQWKTLAPQQPFQYTFLDQAFGRTYASEERLGHLFAIFSALAILIACLGLFALTAFTAEQRTKEIGIRKVLGASVRSIVLLLSREFGRLIVVAFVLAAPGAWFAVRWWLEGYEYKTEIHWMIFAGAGLVAFALAWITMGYQSVKAARSNPVESLRSE